MCGTRIHTPIALIFLRFLLKIAILINLFIFGYIENKAIFPIGILKIKHVEVIFTFFEYWDSCHTFFVFSPASRFGALLLVFGKFVQFFKVFVYFNSFCQLQDFFVDLGSLLLFLFILDKFSDAALAFWWKLGHTQIIFLLGGSLYNLLHALKTAGFMHEEIAQGIAVIRFRGGRHRRISITHVAIARVDIVIQVRRIALRFLNYRGSTKEAVQPKVLNRAVLYQIHCIDIRDFFLLISCEFLNHFLINFFQFILNFSFDIKEVEAHRAFAVDR